MVTSRCSVCGKAKENMEHFMFYDRYNTIWFRGLNRAVERMVDKYRVSENTREILRVRINMRQFRKNSGIQM